MDPRRAMAYSAGAMYAAATVVDLVESLTPGGPQFTMVPGIVALVLVSPIIVIGPRFPRAVLAAFGPLGVALIAYAVSSGTGIGDGAVIYVWPVLWMAYFFGRRGTVATLACVGLAHGLAVASMPPDASYLDRWIDTMIGLSVLGVVVNTLAERNRDLVARLVADARLDPLTGLLNRRGFDERLRVEIERSHRNGSSLCLVRFDADHFKSVNDRWGHEAGDRVLARLGDVLRAQSRAVDPVARVGGEEFVVVLPGCTAAEGALHAERVRAAIQDVESDATPRVTLSAGVVAAASPPDHRALMVAADGALYAAKRAGRDRVVVAEVPLAA
jgi:diguanylate cyclase (GGDEF)-like protein